MPYELYSFGDFRGGLNVDASPENIADNEVPVADNCTLGLLGTIAKRKGTAKVNAVSTNAQITQLIEWQRADGTTLLLAVTDANGTYKLNTVAEDGAFTEVCAVARGKLGWCALKNASMEDKCYFVDGSEYYEWDGENPPAPVVAADGSDLAPIRKCKWLVWHLRNHRVYAAGNPDAADTLYFSEPNAPENFASTSKIVPTGGDGAITALCMFAHALCVFFADSLWAWKGLNPTEDATWTKIPAPYGTRSPDTICLTPNSLTWLSRGEIVSMNPALLDYSFVMLPGDELIKSISAHKVSSITQKIVHHENACAVYDSTTGQYLLAYHDNATATYNERVLVLDWFLQAFTRYTGWQVNSWCKRKNGDLLFGSKNYVLKTGVDEAYTDVNTTDGTDVPVVQQWQTKRTYMGKPFVRKRLRKVMVAGHPGDAISSTIDMTVRAIGYESAYYPGMSFSGAGMRWGDVWGTAWALQDMRVVETKPNLKGDRYQVTFFNDKPGEASMVYSLVMQFRSDRKMKGVKYSEAE